MKASLESLSSAINSAVQTSAANCNPPGENCCSTNLESSLASLNSNESVFVNISLQVNAQILVSTFSEESHQLIKLGEAVGAVLQACIASNKALSSVQTTTQGTTAGAFYSL